MPRAIHVIGTMDSKGRELAFIAERIRAAGGVAVLVDVGTKDAPAVSPDIAREVIADAHPRGRAAVLGLTDRGQAVTAMSEALAVWLRRRHDAGDVSGAIGIGGTGGTALIAPAMRGLPIGVPKLLVSTVASGNTAAYVGASDLVLLPAVVDVAGLNQVSRQLLGNAAHAIAGMVANRQVSSGGKPTLGLTMFGVTTPCVTAVRERLEAEGYDCLVFHATGTGGRAMEQLVADGLVGGVLDITTTEVADEIAGGIFPAGPARFDIIIEKRIPYVMSLGALDMINFGARETVPVKYQARKLHVHNPQ
ncbi:MAG TPA: Tm-1-like ATP-binding domain-containing protein, partial [Planctomycetota bacterium]|nr:Tm-1-like ATP-binding domain-containing protein [Planctomycetota bacterium]